MFVTRTDGFDIQVQPDSGKFYVDFGGDGERDRVYAETMEDVLTKARAVRRSKKVKIDLQVTTRVHSNGVPAGASGTIYGVHGGSKNYLTSWEGIKGSPQFSSYSIGQVVMRRLSEEDFAEWNRLREQIKKLNRELDAIEKKYTLKRDDVDAELKKAGLK